MASQSDEGIRLVAGVALGLLFGVAIGAMPSPINWEHVQWATWFQIPVAVGVAYVAWRSVDRQQRQAEEERQREAKKREAELLHRAFLSALSALGALRSTGEKILTRRSVIPIHRLEDAQSDIRDILKRDVSPIVASILSQISAQLSYEISAIVLLEKKQNSFSFARQGVISRRNVVSAAVDTLGEMSKTLKSGGEG